MSSEDSKLKMQDFIMTCLRVRESYEGGGKTFEWLSSYNRWILVIKYIFKMRT